MNGGAVRIRAPVHVAMLSCARALPAVTPRAPPPFGWYPMNDEEE